MLPKKLPKTERIYPLLALCIIFAGVAMSFFAFHTKSPIVDESVHEAAGYSYWATRDFRLNPEHPPLVKEIAALPLLFLHLRSQTDSAFFSQAHLWDFGPLFIFHNTTDPEIILYAGKTSVFIFFILLGILVYRWSGELFGKKVALIALAFTMFSPNLLAHSQNITTDVAMSFGALFAAYTLTRWLAARTRENFFWLTLALLVMFLVKFSALVVAPIFMVVLFVHSLLFTLQSKKRSFRLFISHYFVKNLWPFLGSLLLVLLGIFFYYNFNFETLSSGIDTTKFIDGIIGALPLSLQGPVEWFTYTIPIPMFHFFEGAVMVITHNEGGHTSFLLGETGNRGWWYYFPLLVLYKSTLAELSLFVGSFASVLFFIIRPLVQRSKKYWEGVLHSGTSLSFDLWVLVLVPFLFFAIAMKSSLNLGLRHVLLVYPFLFVFSGHFIRLLMNSRFGRMVIGAALVLSFGTAILVYPNYLAYFNFLSGGNAQARFIAVDSNVDWGQDLKSLAEYTKQNHIEHIYLSYFGTADPAYYHLSYSPIPTLDQIKEQGVFHGTVVVSTTLLANPAPNIAWLLTYKPTTILNGSLYVFTL